MAEESATQCDDKSEDHSQRVVDMSIEQSSQLIPGFDSVKSFTQNGFKIMTEAIKCSNRIPTGKTRDYYESFSTFHDIMKKEDNKALCMLSTLLKHAGSRSSIVRRDNDEKFEMIVEANDLILERVGSMLDEISGIKKNPVVDLISAPTHVAVSGSWNKQLQPTPSQIMSITTNQTRTINKPQSTFKDKVNNNMHELFIPRIKEKYNSLKPLALLLEEDDLGNSQFSHPYEFELDHFKPLPQQLKSLKPTMYKPLGTTPLIYVQTKAELDSMLNELKNYKEIAVDLEHHAYRTFQGITCLMQISTRDVDYIIDTFTLRDELHVLNLLFTDPKIVKVLHGADMDVLWLQRDLCLYIVNMFDTHQASKLLNYPKLSLAYLLKKFCNVDAQKHFQLADWRVRPLPEELLTYAREDTHYLLYIYDMMKNDLIKVANGQVNLLLSVIDSSTQICKYRYMKPKFDENGFLNIYNKSRKLFDNRQQYALKHLYLWRDSTAREQDESLGYVLPNHMLLNMSESLPREMQGILACCNPVPSLVRQNLSTLHHIILKAREQPLVKPVFEETQNHRSTLENNLNYESLLLCPHDLAYNSEFRDDLPTLLSDTADNGATEVSAVNSSICCKKPNVGVFEKLYNLDKNLPKSVTREICSKVLNLKRQYMKLTPYERYKLVKPFTESLQQQQSESEVTTTPPTETVKKRVVVEVKQEPNPPVSMNEMTREDKKINKLLKDEAIIAPTATELSLKRKSSEFEETSSPVNKKVKHANNPYHTGNDRHNNQQRGNKKQKPEFTAFDYSAVNFDKFQGGSIKNEGQVKTKNRNNKKKSKCWKGQNNKRMTFSK